MKLFINGAARDVEEARTVADAIRLAGAEQTDGVAAAVEGEIIPKSEWQNTFLSEGQHVEVLRAVQGGCR